MIDIKSPLSSKVLIILFLICLLGFIIYSLPVSLVGKELNKNGVYFSNQSGSFWNGQFDQVSMLNTNWQSLELKPSISSLLGQGLRFDFILKSQDRYSQGKSTINDQNLILNDLIIRSDVRYRQNGNSYNSIVGIVADELIIGKNGECQQGDFNIEMDLLNQFSEIMNMDLPAMQGSGLCQNGIVSLNMEASKDGFRASYYGEFVKNKQSGLLSIKLPAIMAQNSQVTNLLGQYGFERMQDQWQSNMEIGL